MQEAALMSSWRMCSHAKLQTCVDNLFKHVNTFFPTTPWLAYWLVCVFGSVYWCCFKIQYHSMIVDQENKEISRNIGTQHKGQGQMLNKSHTSSKLAFL